MDERALQKVTRSAWRTLLRSLEATTAWSTGAGQPVTPGVPTADLAVLLASVGRSFVGRRISFDVAGRRLTAELEALWLDRRDGGYIGRLELRSARWDHLAAEHISIIAPDLTLSPTARFELSSRNVEVQGSLAAPALMAWLSPRLIEWDVDIENPTELLLTPSSGRRPQLLIEAGVVGDEVSLELLAVRWRGRTVRCPRWLRVRRKRPLSGQPQGLSVMSADRRGDVVEFRLRVPELHQVVGPEWLNAFDPAGWDS